MCCNMKPAAGSVIAEQPARNSCEVPVRCPDGRGVSLGPGSMPNIHIPRKRNVKRDGCGREALTVIPFAPPSLSMGGCLCALNLAAGHVRFEHRQPVLDGNQRRVVIGGSTVLASSEDSSMMAAHSFDERLCTNEADVQPSGRHFAASP